MNIQNHRQGGHRETGQDKALESLFSHAEARARAPAEIEQDVRESLHSEWLEMTQRRQRRRTGFAVGMAASVLIAVAVVVNLPDRPGPAPVAVPVASVAKLSGSVYFRDAAMPTAEVRQLLNDNLFAGQLLETGPAARLAIAWPSGESVRLDERTRLSLVSRTEIALLEGRLYLDSGPAAGQGTGTAVLTVRTAAGLIQHLGTQYMASMENSTLAVSVREGRVLVTRDGEESVANPGERVNVTAGVNTRIDSIPTYGALWAWTELVAPEYVLDGRSAFEFIRWVSRETGRPASFASASAEALAHSTMLRGSINLEPMRALDLILQTSDLVATVRNGHIVIGEREET